METRYFTYIGKSGTAYPIRIPAILSAALAGNTPYDGKWCEEKSNGYYCNQPAGHPGPHLAVGHKRNLGEDHAFAIWRNEAQP